MVAIKHTIIQEKSYKFALKIIQLSKKLNREKQFELSRQILRSGTSVGANVEEAIGGQTSKDLRAKLFIAYKEAGETNYWLRLLRDSNLINDKEAKTLIDNSHKLKSILGAILVTLNKK
ncbi:MAG: four helix bundle protein [Balneolaceae bacterium]|nr:four helix bundle protein [Balneolaceae bacterium]